MAHTKQQPAPTGRDLEVINDGRVAQFLGVPPAAGGNGSGTDGYAQPARWGGNGSDLAGRRGTTLVIDRTGDVRAWFTRRKDKEPRPKGTVLLVIASLLVLALAAGQGYVSWFAQFRFILAAKHADTASGIEALGLDAGAVIFALLALAMVRLHRRAIVPRILNVSCAAGSLAMNVLGADLTSPRSIAIYALPSALYATSSDQLISVVRRHALSAEDDEEEQRSSWAMAWRAVIRVTRLATLAIAWVLRAPLYLLRLVIAPGETYGGLRQLVLYLTPLPEIPGLPAAPDPSAGGCGNPPPKDPRGQGRRRKGAPTKKAVLLKAYAAHAGYGDRSKVTQAAKDVADQAGLGPGTARAYIYEFLNATPAGELDRVRRWLLEGGAAA
jgi:hypothetical protein